MSDVHPGPQAIDARLDRVRNLAILAGGAALALCVVLALVAPRAFFSAYLVGFLFWLGIALGCVSITMLHHLTGGSWGMLVRRPMEAGALAVIPLAALFLPILLGARSLYPWTDTAHLDDILRHKLPYLNLPAFAARAALYFAIWAVLALILNRGSARQDRTLDVGPSRRLQQISGPGLGLVFLSASFAAIDWGMSLEPHWFSSLYGPMVIVGWGLTTFASLIVVASLLSDYEPIASVATPGRLNDLGNLMLAFVMLWAYLSFMQFLIMWSGNLSEEIPWYLRRTRGGWQWVALALILFHFFLPFFVLLSRDIKRGATTLGAVAAGVLVMHLLDITWLVVPAPLDPEAPYIPWTTIAMVPVAWLGIGGIFVGVAAWALARKPLVPLHDPAFDDLAHGHNGGH